jgi:histone H3/H4
MEEFFGNLFKKDTNNGNNNTNSNNSNTNSNNNGNNNSNTNSNNNSNNDNNNKIKKTQMKQQINFNDNSIRKLIKKADINLAHKNVYDKVINLYENITKDYANNVDKVVYHRNGKRIGMKDTYLLNNLLNQNMFGGDYSGYCDNNVGQCSDSFASQGGGFVDFCDGHPSQCASNKQQGGFIEFCDGNPSQCSNTKQQGGSISNIQFKKLFKKYTQYSFSKEALNNIHQMVENDLVHYLNNQNNDEDNNKVFTKLQ